MQSHATHSYQDALIGEMPNLKAFAISLCGNPSTGNDLVQETLLKALGNREKFADGTNLKAWLFTILRNTYFSEFRRGRREVADVDGIAAATLASHPGQLSHMDLVDLGVALEKLADDQREALLLVGGEGFSYEEAAEIFGCAVGTVKSRVSRARARLAALMDVVVAEEDFPIQA
jgi:RNA polymerase sigma-70 factor, ECF subfamily